MAEGPPTPSTSNRRNSERPSTVQGQSAWRTNGLEREAEAQIPPNRHGPPDLFEEATRIQDAPTFYDLSFRNKPPVSNLSSPQPLTSPPVRPDVIRPSWTR